MKKLSVILPVVFLSSFFVFGCSEKKSEAHGSSQQIPSFVADTSKKEIPANTPDKDIVRKGVIDLTLIDKNHDGKVYECPMDYNVISDKSGTCPECKMDLEEVTVEKAKENLKGADFQVK